MDILGIIKNRRSIRKFENKEIPEEIVDKLIEALGLELLEKYLLK